jgi:hypothetical protein
VRVQTRVDPRFMLRSTEEQTVTTRWTGHGRPFLPPSDQNSAGHEVLQLAVLKSQESHKFTAELACMDAHPTCIWMDSCMDPVQRYHHIFRWSYTSAYTARGIPTAHTWTCCGGTASHCSFSLSVCVHQSMHVHWHPIQSLCVNAGRLHSCKSAEPLSYTRTCAMNSGSPEQWTMHASMAPRQLAS